MFRAKSSHPTTQLDKLDIIHDNGWVFGDYVDGYIVNNVIEANDEYITIENWVSVDKSTLGQYSGFEDNKGVKIFSGDRIEDIDGRLLTVVYKNGMFAVEKDIRVDYYTCETRKILEPLYNLVIDGCYIVGNVHDE